MGYHLDLVASPPRLIVWSELAEKAVALGWTVLDNPQRLTLEQDGRPIVTVALTEGIPWSKSSDESAMSALLRLADSMGLRVRGEDGESYRTVDDWFLHPDDAPLRHRVDGPTGLELRKQAQSRVNRRAAAVFLPILILSGAAYLWRHWP